MVSIEIASSDSRFDVVDYAVYQAYVDSGKRDKALFTRFADNVITALMKTGMTVIDNAPIVAMKDRIMKASKDLFGLPDHIKEQFIFPGYNERAYVPYGIKKPEDYKNMYLADNAIYQAMRGVDFSQIKDVRNVNGLKKALEIKNHVPDFNDAVVEFTTRARQMGDAFSEVMAYHFELPYDYAESMRNGNNGLRLLQYMPISEDVKKAIPEVTRAKPHADVSAFTFLLTADEPGLKICTKEAVNEIFGTNFITKKQIETEIPDEYWSDFLVGEGQCIVNVGRALEALSNGKLLATPHKVELVEGREKQERFSIPFFHHLPWNMKLNTWEKAIAMRGGENYFAQTGDHEITIGEYVLEDEKRPWVEPKKPVPIYRP